MSRWQPYPAYKPSGVEWLGEIPAHWKIMGLKRACSLITDGSHFSPPTRPEGRPYVTVRDLTNDGINIDSAARISDEDFTLLERNGCRPRIGDVLFSKDGTIGKVAVVHHDDFVVLSSLAILRPDQGTNSDYLRFFLTSRPGIEQMESWLAGAALRRITLDIIVNLIAVSPPIPEQKAIAAFLDRETARIDALIAKQERLIALLQEKRVALISHTVTKGLDPAAPLKDSGIPWLGEIPAHWKVSRLRHLVKEMRAGPFGSSLTKELYTPEGYRVYGQEQVIPGDFSIGDYYISEEKYCSMQQYAVTPGDVLVSCVGTFGKVAVVPNDVEPGIINPRLIKLKPAREIIAPEYLEIFLRSSVAFGQMEQVSRGGTMGVINLTLLSGLWLTLPPLSEQQVLTEYNTNKMAKLDTLIAKAREVVERLQEYRAALISAAVTGKIDVRGVGAVREPPLPKPPYYRKNDRRETP